MDPFTIDHQVQITRRAVQRLKNGHLWIYAGDVVRESENITSPIVQVTDKSENILGCAFYSRQSNIRLRFLCRKETPPTPDLMYSRLEKAIERRKHICNKSDACRLVFGEADLLPGIIVDRYDNYLVLQTLSYGADTIKPFLTESLVKLVRPLGILERNDVKARRLEGLEEVRGILFGEVPEEVEIVENGVRFLVNMMRGQKTGFFLDQSHNRITCRHYAFGRALDCFTNTGAFALHLARGCDSVLAVDISAESLSMARRNSALNGCRNVRFDEGNVFDYLRRLENSGESFDIVCLDPPAFAKNRSAFAGARKGYKEINLRALKLIKEEGILVTSSCSYHLSANDFLELLSEAARDAHRYIQILERRGQAPDHPVLSGMPETEYLKCFILRVL